MKGVVIEHLAEPLSPDKKGKPQRGQLHQTVWVDGEQIAELSYPLGSPASWEIVKAQEKTVKLG